MVSLNLDSLFPPYSSYSLEALPKSLSPANMSQEIIKRFGIFYSTFLNPEKLENLTKKNPAPQTPPETLDLTARISLIWSRYTEYLNHGSFLLQQRLHETSTLGGRSCEEVMDNHLAIFNYLPMPVEQLSFILFKSPKEEWSPPLLARFEDFLSQVQINLAQATTDLFTYMDAPKPPTPASKMAVQNLLLTKAALPTTPQDFIPFLDSIAEWANYLSLQPPGPQRKLDSLKEFCSCFDISFDFVVQRGTLLTPPLLTGALSPPYPSFRAYLAARSVQVFCQNLQLNLSEPICHKLASQFEDNESSRRAFAFFSCSKSLQTVLPSLSLRHSFFYLCLCFSSFKQLISLPFAEADEVEIFPLIKRVVTSISLDEVPHLLSLFFEWLMAADSSDLAFLSSLPHTYGCLEILTALIDIMALSLPPHTHLKAFIFMLSHRNDFAKISINFSYCPQISVGDVFKWIFFASSPQQETLFHSLNHQIPISILHALGARSLPAEKMSTVLIFLLKEETSFEQTLAFIDELHLETTVQEALKMLFLENIHIAAGKPFLALTTPFQALRHALAQNYHQAPKFYTTFDPLFVWYVHAPQAERVRFLDNGKNRTLITQRASASLRLMNQMTIPVEKKLSLLNFLLLNLPAVAQFLRTLKSLSFQDPSMKPPIQEAFFQALATQTHVPFFQTAQIFLKFKSHCKAPSSYPADDIFIAILNASPSSQAQFESHLEQVSPATLVTSLELTQPISRHLKVLNHVLGNFSFICESLEKFRSLNPPERYARLQGSFIQKYSEETDSLKSTTAVIPERELLHHYVRNNLNALLTLLPEFSFPNEEVVIPLCFHPLFTQALTECRTFFRPCTNTENTEAFYTTVWNFINKKFTPLHIHLLIRALQELQLIDSSYNIFSVVNLIDCPKLTLQKRGIEAALALLKKPLCKRLTIQHIIELFFYLIQFNPAHSHHKLQELEAFESVIGCTLSENDIFNWMVYSSAQDELLLRLQLLGSHIEILRRSSEETSSEVYPRICTLLTQIQEDLHVPTKQATSAVHATFASLKAHVGSCLILLTPLNLSAIFSWEAISQASHCEQPLVCTYPQGKTLSLCWKWEERGTVPNYPFLTASLFHPTAEADYTASYVLSLSPSLLAAHPPLFEFLSLLLQDLSLETRQLTGDFTADLSSFSDPVQQMWDILTLSQLALHQTKDEIGSILYLFALQLRCFFRKGLLKILKK